MSAARGRVVLVTGGARGIGRAVCERFAENGERVAVNYLRSETEAEALVARLRAGGCDSVAVRADVGDPDAVARMFQFVRRELGEPEVLVNNAGISARRLFTDITPAEWGAMFRVHVTGAYLCSREAVPAMVRARRGKIVNVSSVWGLVGASMEVHYSAAKAALVGLTKALAKELAPSNVQVNCVAPGVIETGMNAELSPDERAALGEEIPQGRFGAPREAAEAVFFLSSGGADYITGQVLAPSGGWMI